MNGTEALIEVLAAAGVRYLFGNPGHTELPLLDVLAGREGPQYVLGLNEAVAMAMADGYAMASGRLGVFCAHITPGLGNALGMLYDASRTGAPVLVLAGQQDGRFAFTEPALWGDLVALARPLVKWAYQVERPDDLPRALRRAIKVATTPPAGPVALALPSDVLRAEGTFDVGPPAVLPARVRADAGAVARAGELLAAADAPLIVAGDEVGRADAQAALVAVAELLGAPVYSEPSSNTPGFPTDHALYQGALGRVQKAAHATLAQADVIFAVGASVFTMATWAELDPLPPGPALVQLNADPWELGKNYVPTVALWGDPRATLEELATHLRPRADAERARRRAALAAGRRADALAAVDREADSDRRPIAPARLMRAVVEAVPADAILVDEANTSGLSLRTFLFRRNLTYFGLKGGGLGWGLPASVGVHFAALDRPVVALLGDGSAMYTVQALWTAAHHRARVAFVVCNNRQYRIVKHRLHRYGGAAARHRRYPGVELDAPAIDFVALARSLGVRARRVEDPEALAETIAEAVGSEGPALVDVAVEGSYPEREAAR